MEINSRVLILNIEDSRPALIFHDSMVVVVTDSGYATIIPDGVNAYPHFGDYKAEVNYDLYDRIEIILSNPETGMDVIFSPIATIDYWPSFGISTNAQSVQWFTESGDIQNKIDQYYISDGIYHYGQEATAIELAIDANVVQTGLFTGANMILMSGSIFFLVTWVSIRYGRSESHN